MTLAAFAARGMAAPASATAQPLARLGAACAGGWPFLAPPSRLRRPRLGCGWNSLAVRSLASASGVALGVKIGGVLRGGQLACGEFCRALWPCGLRVGARAWMRYAAEPPRAQPRLRSALGLSPSLTRVVQIRRGRRISNAACPSAPSQADFWAHFVALGAMKAPRASISPKNRLQKALQAACNSPRVSR